MKRGASEITTTIMMNFICTYFVYALITGPLKDPGAFYAASRGVPKAYLLPDFPINSGLNIGVYFVFVIAIIVALFMKYTVSGMRLKASGMNMEAARAAGISVNRLIVFATCGRLAPVLREVWWCWVLPSVLQGWLFNGHYRYSCCTSRRLSVRILPLALFSKCETGAVYASISAFSIGKRYAGITGCYIYVCFPRHLLKSEK